MKALIKTLFGDVANIACVAAVIALAAALTESGHATLAVYAMPVAALAGVAWLASR